MRDWLSLLFFLIINAWAFGLQAQKITELGDVNWLRNLEEAKEQARKSDKPIFILFQEVPGCHTCREFGKRVLEHPLLVEAIEDHFIPLAIYNNKQGHDDHVLNMYNEPAWNNPVLRVVDSEGKSILDRLSGYYSPYEVVVYLQKALIEWKEPIPPYLSLLEEELRAVHVGLKETYLSMFCFWSGEKHIGKIAGVISTEAGYMDGKEVVKVGYAPDLLNYEDLVRKAQSVQCASSSYTNDAEELKDARSLFRASEIHSPSSYRKDRQDKYYLRKSDLRFIPLTTLQKTRFNSMIGQGLDPSHMLSPRQLRYFQGLNLNKAHSQLENTFEKAEQLL